MLTLLLIPVLYSLFDRKKYLVENDNVEGQEADSDTLDKIAEV